MLRERYNARDTMRELRIVCESSVVKQQYDSSSHVSRSLSVSQSLGTRPPIDETAASVSASVTHRADIGCCLVDRRVCAREQHAVHITDGTIIH